MGSTAMMFKALADENRLLLLRLLLRRNCCVRALARQLDISEAAVSQHLKVLREAGLIFGEKCGYFMHYTVNRAALKELSSQLSRMAFSAEQLPCTPQHGGCSRAEYDKCRNAAQPQAEHILHVAENRIFDSKGSMNMKIAVTYQNGLVFQHFGHSEAFKIYEIENGEVKNAEVAICGRAHKWQRPRCTGWLFEAARRECAHLRRHRRRCAHGTCRSGHRVVSRCFRQRGRGG